MSYSPTPGTTPDRAIAWLRSQPLGTEVSTSTLAASAGVPHGDLTVAMQPALRARLVFARQKGGHMRSPLFWSLVDHRKLRAFIASTTPGGDSKPEADEDRPVPRTIPAAGAPPLPIVPPLFPPLPKGLRSNPVVHIEKRDTESEAAQAGPARDGSQKPDGVRPERGAKAGSETHPKGDNRDASTEQSHGAAGSESPSSRGENVAPALGASPHVSPVGGPMGAGQAAAAAPAGDLDVPLVGRTATISMTGEVAVVAECGTVILFDAQRGRQLVQWLAGRVV